MFMFFNDNASKSHSFNSYLMNDKWKTWFLVLLLVQAGESAVSLKEIHEFSRALHLGPLNPYSNVTGIRSTLVCASLCGSGPPSGGPLCGGFHYDSKARTCRLLRCGLNTETFAGGEEPLGSTVIFARIGGKIPATTTTNTTTMTTMTSTQSTPTTTSTTTTPFLCPAHLGFLMVSQGRGTFCLQIIPKTDHYMEALDICKMKGGRLIHFDSTDKYGAIQKLWSVSGIKDSHPAWVGASDRTKEGVWLSEFDQQPLNTSLWLWDQGEPNDRFFGENCASLDSNLVLNDEKCSLNRHPLCEVVP